MSALLFFINFNVAKVSCEIAFVNRQITALQTIITVSESFLNAWEWGVYTDYCFPYQYYIFNDADVWKLRENLYFCHRIK